MAHVGGRPFEIELKRVGRQACHGEVVLAGYRPDREGAASGLAVAWGIGRRGQGWFVLYTRDQIGGPYQGSPHILA